MRLGMGAVSAAREGRYTRFLCNMPSNDYSPYGPILVHVVILLHSL